VRAILDAGAFVAIDKHDRRVGAMLRVLQQQGVPLRTSSAVIAQVWRDGRRQAALARLLPSVDVRPLAPDQDKRCGELLAASRTNDVVDGHVAILVHNGDVVLTSDADDIEHLLAQRNVEYTVAEV
jgi:hypothetical protein